MTNPYPYTDKAADLVQEASMVQVAVFKQDSDNISIPVSHIDGMSTEFGTLGLHFLALISKLGMDNSRNPVE